MKDDTSKCLSPISVEGHQRKEYPVAVAAASPHATTRMHDDHYYSWIHRPITEPRRDGQDTIVSTLPCPNRTIAGFQENQQQQRKSKRHGARNQHKMKDFVVWLIQTFSDSETPWKQQHPIILDVACGKGELAARMVFCHRTTKVIMVDPRKADVAAVYTQTVVPHLPKKWQASLQQRMDENTNFVHEMVHQHCQQLVTYFTEETVKSNPDLREAVQKATLLIGMHADSATEAIVDTALLHRKAFVVVPCCVFANLFVDRRLLQQQEYQQVRTWEEFCEYLLQKDPCIKKQVLPFDGRNVALYWDGKESK